MPGRPSLPGSPMGGPSGPGAPPMASAGGGAGNEAAADSMIAAVMGTLHKAMQAYPLGSKKYSAVLNAVRALSANFGKQETQAMVPAAIKQLGMNAKPGAGPLAASPPPPLAAAPPPGAGGGEGGGGPGEMPI